MLGLYVLQRFQTEALASPIFLPKAFVVSTLILLGSSYLFSRARLALREDKVKLTLNYLFGIFGMGLLFSVFQCIGWAELYSGGLGFPNMNVASSYVYVITGIHLIHVLMALGLISMFIFQLRKRTRDVVAELLYVTNPYEKRKFEIVSGFWHFVDALWVVLFVVFLLTF
jgi:cytochrome c oxidase subunit III